MARTAVPLSTHVDNGTLPDPAGTSLDATNSHVVSASRPEDLVLRVQATNAGGGTITVKAGSGPLAGLGDLAVVFAQNDVKWLGPFTSDRFLQSDGTFNVDVGAGMTGKVTAFQLDRKA